MTKVYTSEIEIPLFKVILCGKSGVGKTNILQVFNNEPFQPKHLSTVGLDFRVKKLEMDDGLYKLQVIDTAGKKNLKLSNIKEFFESVDAIVVVYDITSKSSGKYLKDIKEEIDKMELNNKNYTYILVGNKSDDRDNRKISVDDGTKLSKEFDDHFLEVSAKDNKYIVDLFEMVIRSVNEKRLDIRRIDELERRNNSKGKNEEKQGCCFIF